MTISVGLPLIIELKRTVSDCQDRIAGMIRYISKKSEEVSEIGKTIAMIENRVSTDSQSYNIYYAQQSNPMLQGPQAKYNEARLQELQMSINYWEPKLDYLNAKKCVLKEEEEELVGDKVALEAKMKVAEESLKGAQEDLKTHIRLICTA